MDIIIKNVDTYTLTHSDDKNYTISATIKDLKDIHITEPPKFPEDSKNKRERDL